MNTTEEFRSMAVKIMVNASTDLRKKLIELGFTPNAVRHIEKNVFSFFTDKELNAKFQEVLDNTSVYG